MAAKIGTQHGVEATRLALRGNDPEGKVAYDKLLGVAGRDYGAGPVEGTVLKLIQGHNEAIDRLAALEQAVGQRPFG